MPYKNVPEHLWDDMDSCVQDVMDKQGVEKERAVAICHNSIVKDGTGKSAFLDFYLVMKREWTAEMREKLKKGEMRGEFAGPDESFPIAGPEDVHAAYMSAGRAGGDPEAIRRNVIRIAKKYGWESGLPESVKEDDKKGRKEKSMSIALSGVITKAQRMSDGRVKWRARVNSGQFDQEGERFDRSYFDELIKNFAVQQESLSKSEAFPIQVKLDDGFTLTMNEPIADISHYSYFMELGNRNKARVGYPVKLWLDGDALMSEGYYDKTPLGELAAKAALAERDIEKRRMSLGTYPDWGLVEVLPSGQRVFKGGRGRAWLDHQAITSCPVDTDTEIITLSEVSPMETQKDDALTVLGKDAEELVDELEKAKVKSEAADGTESAAVLKAEESKVEETKTEESKVEEQETEKAEGEKHSPEAEEAVKSFLTDFMPRFGEKIVERMDAAIKASLADMQSKLDAMEAKVNAVTADETTKIKAALDNPENWVESLVEKSLSVQHGSSESVVKGKPAQEAPASEFARSWGNPPAKK